MVSSTDGPCRARRDAARSLAVRMACCASLAIAILGCGEGDEADAGPTPLPPIRSSSEVVADAVVVPAQHASLGFEGGGTIEGVTVAEGDMVQKGQILVRIDAATEAAAVLQAEADVAAAEAQLVRLLAGPTDEELRAAQAVVEGARAAARSASGQVASAAASRDKVVSGATNSDVAVARRRIESAKNILWGTQAQRDAVCGRVDTPYAEQADCDQAEAEVGRMHEEVRIAQLEFDRLLIGARSEDVRAVSAGVSAAQGQLEGANAEVARAQAMLEQVQAGSTEADVEIARIRVDQANAALEAARARMDRTVLRAPFSATVATVDARPGEQVGPGVPVIRLADTGRWLIETDSLTELRIVDVVDGAPVRITIDALPDLELTGRVDRIRSFGENTLGDITYRVIVVPDQHDPRLRWNMTAAVTIEAADPPRDSDGSDG